MATQSDFSEEPEITGEEILLKNGSETSSVNWMPIPEGVSSDSPCGLEYLTNVDQMIISQVVDVTEAVSGFKTRNKYKIRNSLGQNMYYAYEVAEPTCTMRRCCGKCRTFELGISTSSETEVIRLIKPYRCSNFLGWCYLQEMEIQCPPGVAIGWIKQEHSILSPCFSIKDENEDVVYRVRGPCFSCKWCDVEFHVVSADESTSIGVITKQWSGLAKEYFSDADNFGIRFPSDMDVKIKALMIGAVFLIDFMYFQQ